MDRHQAVVVFNRPNTPVEPPTRYKGTVRPLHLLFQKVNDLEKNVDKNAATVIESINRLRQEVQQSNRTLAALANHRHATDGNTTFVIP